MAEPEKEQPKEKAPEKQILKLHMLSDDVIEQIASLSTVTVTTQGDGKPLYTVDLTFPSYVVYRGIRRQEAILGAMSDCIRQQVEINKGILGESRTLRRLTWVLITLTGILIVLTFVLVWQAYRQM